METEAGGRTVATGSSTFEWVEGALFLRQRSDGRPLEGAPREWFDHWPQPSTMIIGLDETAREYAGLYADARGVRRVYRMLFTYPVWTFWREAPGFHQRFTGTFSNHGRTIRGRGDVSPDGHSWSNDVELTYRRR
ncbi:MAG TPA: hypothetical protein VGK63_09450 [Candidatus Limnocylindrales bacterium]